MPEKAEGGESESYTLTPLGAVESVVGRELAERVMFALLRFASRDVDDGRIPAVVWTHGNWEWAQLDSGERCDPSE